MYAFFKYIAGEGKVILDAPIIFATALGIVIVGTYWFVRHQFKDRIDSVNGQIKLRDDRISEYEKITKSSSPDEASERLRKIEYAVKDIKDLKGNPILDDWSKLPKA